MVYELSLRKVVYKNSLNKLSQQFYAFKSQKLTMKECLQKDLRTNFQQVTYSIGTAVSLLLRDMRGQLLFQN